MLEIKKVRVSYNGITALTGVDIEIKENKVVTILGVNGAGKSTLCSVVSGLIYKGMKGQVFYEGKVIYNGEEISNISAHSRVRLGISYCPEGRGIFTRLTVEENLRLGAFCVKDSSRWKKSIDQVMALFPKLGERIHLLAGNLSGGEQQMLAIGRALMSEPKLLILDEPFLGLDPNHRQIIQRKMKEIKNTGTTVFIAEQSPSGLMELTDYVYILNAGQVVKEGMLGDSEIDSIVREIILGKVTSEFPQQ